MNYQTAQVPLKDEVKARVYANVKKLQTEDIFSIGIQPNLSEKDIVSVVAFYHGSAQAKALLLNLPKTAAGNARFGQELRLRPEDFRSNLTSTDYTDMLVYALKQARTFLLPVLVEGMAKRDSKVDLSTALANVNITQPQWEAVYGTFADNRIYGKEECLDQMWTIMGVNCLSTVEDSLRLGFLWAFPELTINPKELGTNLWDITTNQKKDFAQYVAEYKRLYEAAATQNHEISKIALAAATQLNTNPSGVWKEVAELSVVGGYFGELIWDEYSFQFLDVANFLTELPYHAVTFNDVYITILTLV